MQVKLHSTSRIVELAVRDPAGREVLVPARIWEGHTEAGIPVIAWVTRIAAERDQDLAEFEADLAEQRPPSPAAEEFPLRMLLG